MTSGCSSASQELRDLLSAYVRGNLSAGEFSQRVEHSYNFDTDRDALARAEQAAFQKIFDIVVWYSPYPDDRARIPHYKSEADIEDAARQTLAELG